MLVGRTKWHPMFKNAASEISTIFKCL